MATQYAQGEGPWSDEEKQYLQDHWGKQHRTAIAAHLKRSMQGIIAQARRQGLKFTGIKPQPLAQDEVDLMLADARSGATLNRLVEKYRRHRDKIADALEARGFLFGPKRYARVPISVAQDPAAASSTPEDMPKPLWRPPSASEVANLPLVVIGPVTECQFPKWPHGIRTPKEPKFCGAPVFKNSLCEECWGLCWTSRGEAA